MSEIFTAWLTLSETCLILALWEVIMIDGQFKNLKLGRCWKRFAEALQNRVVDSFERCALASEAVVRELLTEDFRALVSDLEKYAARAQRDLDPVSGLQGIFDRHSKMPFADTFQKEMAFRLCSQASPELALGEALEAAVNIQLQEVRTRLEDEFIHARDTKKLGRQECMLAIQNIAIDLGAIDRHRICVAIRTHDSKDIKKAASKKDGLDEGPAL
jgi:hypothetical protein